MPRSLPAFVVLALAASTTHGGVIVGYQPGSAASINTYDRFPNGLASPTANGSPQFIGAGLDLSGIGWRPDAPESALTLIAPRYVIGAWHVPLGPQLSFANAAGAVTTVTVAQSYRLTTGGVDSDVRLVRLTTAIDPAATGVRPIGVADVTAAGAVGLNALAYGQNPAYNVPVDGSPAGTPNPDRRQLGRAVISQVTTATFAPPNEPSPTRVVIWENGSQPGDVALIGGDSGGPLLVRGVNGDAALLGAHFGAGPNFSASSFLPEYVGQINTILSDNGDLPLVLVTPVPEPAGLLAATGLGLLVARQRRRAAA